MLPRWVANRVANRQRSVRFVLPASGRRHRLLHLRSFMLDQGVTLDSPHFQPTVARNIARRVAHLAHMSRWALGTPAPANLASRRPAGGGRVLCSAPGRADDSMHRFVPESATNTVTAQDPKAQPDTRLLIYVNARISHKVAYFMARAQNQSMP
jgi:hypothetical protein